MGRSHSDGSDVVRSHGMRSTDSGRYGFVFTTGLNLYSQGD